MPGTSVFQVRKRMLLTTMPVSFVFSGTAYLAGPPHIVYQSRKAGCVTVFVFSVKTTKKQMISIIVCVVMLIAILVVAIVWPSNKTSATGAQPYTPVAAGSDEARIGYLRTLGYEASPSTAEVKEVLIPDEFDEVFQNYNTVQAEAGMDLEPYHGKRVKCWSYRIDNYPGEDDVLAHLYVYNDKIIGGDICSTKLDGFMHGLTKMDAPLTSTAA